MKFDKSNMLLYAITDSRYAKDKSLYELVEEALKGGATLIQLREKNLDFDEFLKRAINLKKLCTKYDVPLIINDNVDIAIKSNADGVHVGQTDMNAKNVRELIGKNMILGVSAQTCDQAVKAEEAGADYLGVGAVFSTSTKNNASVISMEEVKNITKSVNIPICAIGGINKENIMMLKGSGVDGVSLISAIFSANDIKKECETLLKLSKEMVKP